jgi:SAM-dependent methyltransferase
MDEPSPEPPARAAEIYGRRAIGRIVRQLPPLERAYSFARFLIMRPKILSVMDLLLPDRGRILDLGCGFGLFATYFGQTQPLREIIGIDVNPKRVEMATKVAAALGLEHHRFMVGDVRDVDFSGTFSACYVIDVMHHLPAEAQLPVLERLRDLLGPGGVLIIKDITTDSRFGLAFTEALDRLMVGFKEPLAYRHHSDWGAMLTRLGFQLRIARVPDILPYPHVIIAARKP